MAQANPQRTPEELNNPSFNYFIACKINVNETNSTKIGEAIKAATSSTAGSVESRRLLELKNDCNETLCNDAVFENGQYIPNKGGRKKEADRAVGFKKKEAREVIDVLCKTRTTLLKSDLLDICDKVNKPYPYFQAEDFLKELMPYLSGINVKVIDNVDNRIPFNDFQKIDKTLEPINKADLYEFLGVGKNAGETEIKGASDDKYKESQKGSDLKKKQTYSSLCGLVKKVLLSGKETRKAYDQYLLLKKDVWDDFAKLKGLGIKEITLDGYQKYSQIIVNLARVSSAEAEKIVAIGCKFFQLTIVGKSEGNTLETCPYDECGKLYIRGLKSCPHCGKPLEVLCWNCGQTTRITKEDKGCPNCGATARSQKEFNAKCQTMDRLLMSPSVEISELKSALLAIRNVVPNSSKQGSTVFKKAAEYERQVGERVKQEETMGARYKEEVSNIQKLMGKRAYQSAYSIAQSLQIKYNNYNVENSKKLLATISNTLNIVNQHVSTAKRFMDQGNVNLAIASAAKAIDLCDDCQDARQIMQKYPPKPVSNLRAQPGNGNIKLQWEDIKQDFVMYTVIKKIGAPPKGIADGTKADECLSVKFYEDKNVSPATPYYYAVVAVRYGVNSPVATITTPVAVFPDVSNVQQELVNSGGIKATWNSPQNVKQIEVWKKPGAIAPGNPGDGKQLDNTGSGFTDSNCQGLNAYLIICKYVYNGKAVYSGGIRVVYKPYETIAPLADVKITHLEDVQYKLSCSGEYNGKVRLYYGDRKLPIAYDSVLKYIDFNKICKGLNPIETSNVNNELFFTLPREREFFVYPIVQTEQLFVVSPPILVNTYCGLANCSYTFTNGAVRIKGGLNPKAQKIIVLVGNEKYAETMDPKFEKYTFTADAFRKDGFIELKLKVNSDYYITLFVEFSNAGITSYSEPVKVSPPIVYRETVTVLYSIEYTVSPQKPFKVTLSFEADSEVKLPKLLLMQGAPKPIDKSAGKLCEKIEEVSLKKGLFSRKYTAKKTITAQPVSRNTKFALFLNDETAMVRIKEVRNL